MPYVADTYIEPKLFYGIVGLAVSNVVAIFVMLAVLASTDEQSSGAGVVARCQEISPYDIDGSDDKLVCEAITRDCVPGSSLDRCKDDASLCEAVMTSAGGDAGGERACYYTAAAAAGAGAGAAPPLPQLTCADYSQLAGLQAFPCPQNEFGSMPLLRQDAASVHCLPSLTTSCDAGICCTRIPPPMLCSDTNADGVPDLFDCGAPWQATPDSPTVETTFLLNEDGVCDRRAGGCSPYDCCTIPPQNSVGHDVAAETYPLVAVQRFYEGVDTGDIALMNARVADNYQAIFTDGCVEVGGASHCGAAVYSMAEFDQFISTHPTQATRFTSSAWDPNAPGPGTLRSFTVTMDNSNQCSRQASGGCGVVMEQYVVQESILTPAVRSAAVHKVEGGLLVESIWYTNARGKSLRVQEFYTNMNLCGSDNEAACDLMDQYVDVATYVAVFSPTGVAGDANFRPAAVGGMQKITPSPGQTYNLDELKDFLKAAPARCQMPADGAAGSCMASDERTYDQQGHSVIEHYKASVKQEDGVTPVDTPVEGISVNRFVDGLYVSTSGEQVEVAKIVETYFYTQHADEQCSDAGRSRVSRAFLNLIDDLSLMLPGNCPPAPQPCEGIRGDLMSQFDELYWHDGDDRSGTFTAVVTSGAHTLGLGIRTTSGINRIYDEQGFANLIQHTTQNAGLGATDAGRAINYDYCEGDPTTTPPTEPTTYRCLTRDYTSQGDNVFVQYQVYNGNSGSEWPRDPDEQGGILLTFDEEKISQAYWFSM